jgi:glycosyltransferase involved in cell wall biosynthesis
VLSEAIVAGTPVLASRIPGSVGILGENYAGYFDVGDTRGLARLMHRAESDPELLARLKRDCMKLRPRFDPARERASWRKLIAECRRQGR